MARPGLRVLEDREHGTEKMLTQHAAWVLLINFALSVAYEYYRATAKAGVSRHDSMGMFVRQLPIYAVAAAVVAALFIGVPGAAWIGLIFSVLGVLVSMFYYNPTIMLERQPGIIDWIEDLVFTGLLFVSATLLLYEVLGFSLHSAAT
jgi:hypothetical protein